MRLAFPAKRSLGLWEMVDLHDQESEAEAEEGCRLVYVAASRARDRLILSGAFRPADLEPAEELKPGDSPLRRLLPALAERGLAGIDGELGLPGPRPIGGSLPLPDATLRTRVSEPSPERAAELRRVHELPPRPDPLQDATEVTYGMTQYHEPEFARGVRWNDPVFGIEWPNEVRVISERDRASADFEVP